MFLIFMYFFPLTRFPKFCWSISDTFCFKYPLYDNQQTNACSKRIHEFIISVAVCIICHCCYATEKKSSNTSGASVHSSRDPHIVRTVYKILSCSANPRSFQQQNKVFLNTGVTLCQVWVNILKLWHWMISSYGILEQWSFISPGEEIQPLHPQTH